MQTLTCRSRDNRCKAMVALHIVQDIEYAHAHPVLAATVHVALHLASHKQDHGWSTACAEQLNS